MCGNVGAIGTAVVESERKRMGAEGWDMYVRWTLVLRNLSVRR